ncbi:MAG: NAD(P)H-dependent oxidoreductase [Rhodospirillaceae bacterium]|jgi:NAD(P)H dehydrogenase (quinone)|nr:NAD(P)H-dependent oxidoreductase [Rhodospirillaceae bacterium]MBT6118754.1 NAD(P)H-dependent oxidoreductase [Rhodospirillaceae bacterium]
MPGKNKKVLIVLGHPEPNSYNAALAATAVETLEAMGHEARITNLYAKDLDARVTRADFTEARNPDFFAVMREQANAFKKDAFVPAVQAEIELLQWCDGLILQYPIWWFGMPAILKGYMDRIFVPGVAYGRGKWYEIGPLAGKRALVSCTADCGIEAYSPRGRYGDLSVLLWPIHQALRFTGFDVLAPAFTGHVSDGDEARAAGLAAHAERLKGFATDAPMDFHTEDDYADTYTLKPGVKGKTIGQWGE